MKTTIGWWLPKVQNAKIKILSKFKFQNLNSGVNLYAVRLLKDGSVGLNDDEGKWNEKKTTKANVVK